MMKASYLQMNHLSRMLKPGGMEEDVPLKSSIDGETREGDVHWSSRQSKCLLMLMLITYLDWRAEIILTTAAFSG